LLEGVLAIGVLLVGVVGSLVLITTTIKLGRTNQDRIVAQNLAREGMELAYAHRNAGSLSTVEFTDGTWDRYLVENKLKSGGMSELDYKDKYDLGDVDGGMCKFFDGAKDCGTFPAELQPKCTNTSDDPYTEATSLSCDVQILSDYLFGNLSIMPPGCNDGDLDNSLGFWIGPDALHKSCNFSGNDSPSPNVADVTAMVDELLRNAHGFQAGYPTIALVPAGAAPPPSTFSFFTTPTSIDLNTGTYSLDEAWGNAASQVYEVSNTYSQNVTIAGAVPTKFYRVVTFQPICKGRETSTDSYEEWVVKQDSAANCRDDALFTEGWAETPQLEATKIGVLVTSEVRWPSPTSNTKVSYQEYLYNWISI
jgi:hypothetical protein